MKSIYKKLIAIAAVIGAIIGFIVDSRDWLLGAILGTVIGFVLVTLHDCNWNPLAVFDPPSRD